MNRLVDALATMETVDIDVWASVGPSLTCTEAVALVRLFDALGLRHHAEGLAIGHALTDGEDEGDDHHVDTTTGELEDHERRALEVFELVDAGEPVECTGLAASWCPVHGACTCPRTESGDGEERSLDDLSCPLHAPQSSHGEPSR